MKQSSTSSSNYEKHTSKNPLLKLLISLYYAKLQKLIPHDAKIVLDVGCGEGFLTKCLPQHISYTGVDYSKDAITLAKSSTLSSTNYQLQTTDFSVADIFNLPFTNNSFDLVFCLEVLEHLENFERALQEIKRVAKKHVILSVPNEPWFQLSNFLRGKYLSGWGNHPEHINRWNKKQFPTLVSKYFTIIKAVYTFPWQIIICKI